MTRELTEKAKATISKHALNFRTCSEGREDFVALKLACKIVGVALGIGVGLLVF